VYFDTLQIRVAGFPGRSVPVCTASRPNLLILTLTALRNSLLTKIFCVLFWTVLCLLHPLSMHYCMSLIWILQFHCVLNGTGQSAPGTSFFHQFAFLVLVYCFSANFKFFCRRLLVKAAQSWPWLNTCCDIKAPSLLIVYSFDLLVLWRKHELW
jgi:hypothetical protein